MLVRVGQFAAGLRRQIRDSAPTGQSALGEDSTREVQSAVATYDSIAE